MARGLPEIQDWSILRNGCVRGIVKDHPVIDDGDTITTSKLANPDVCNENTIVVTTSGSKYKLLQANSYMKKILSVKEKKQDKKVVKPAKKKVEKKMTLKISKDVNNKVEKKPPSKKVEKKAKKPIDVIPSVGKPLPLSGKSVGNGQYVLVGKMVRTTSGKSQLWNAYRTDADGNPIVQNIDDGCSSIKVKLSTNVQALLRENANYDKVTSGIFYGKFVKKLDFFPVAQGPGFDNLSALIMESGSMDLKELLASRGFRGFSGKEMRDVAAAAGQCVQAMHAAQLVWTDLKSENFVVTDDGIRGIDLESAIRFKGNPVDYSPEACPPEFASAFLKGEAGYFELDPSYDMWSMGMLLYELSTGKGYFEGKSAGYITKTVRNEEFVPDVSPVEDANLRDLIKECLRSDPKKRPDITQFLLHPYFTTTGVGPFSFFWLNNE